MASTLEYMQFATGVYAASVANTLEPTTATGWTRVDWQPDTGAGFSAGVYKNDATNEMVIAYTGTNETIDPFAGWTAGLGMPAPQIFDAVAYYIAFRDAYPNCSISFTGHSLGGATVSQVKRI